MPLVDDIPDATKLLLHTPQCQYDRFLCISHYDYVFIFLQQVFASKQVTAPPFLSRPSSDVSLTDLVKEIIKVAKPLEDISLSHIPTADDQNEQSRLVCYGLRSAGVCLVMSVSFLRVKVLIFCCSKVGLCLQQSPMQFLFQRNFVQ